MNNNLFLRILSSVVLAPLCFYIIYKGSFYFICFLLICLGIITIEVKKLISSKMHFFTLLVFISFSFFCAYTIRYYYIGDETKSLIIFYGVLLISISTDIGGYVFGKIIRGPKLTVISPNKTYSGSVGGLILTVLILIIYSINFSSEINFFYNLYSNNSIYFFFIIISASLLSQIGDLTISFLKRKAKIKNTGNIIPGHGGILDRMDGMIFTFPYMYIWIMFLDI